MDCYTDSANRSRWIPDMEVSDSLPDQYVVTFTRNEAIVLEGLLARWSGSDERSAIELEDQAEQRLLWDLTCVIAEGPNAASVAAGSTDDWTSIIAAARDAVRDPNTEPGPSGLS